MPALGAISFSLDAFGSIGAAVVLVGLLVFIHEFGHFIVAKACGVGVPVFSIGFGRRVAGIQIGETDYRLSALPFGGYVLLAGADPYGYVEDEEADVPVERRFLEKPVWQRLLVIGAGPAMNLALPFVVFTALFMAGEPQPASEVGEVAPDSVAAAAGLLPGDRIVSIDGQQTPSILAVADVVGEFAAGEHSLEVDRRGTSLTLTAVVPDDFETKDFGVSTSRRAPIVGVDDPASPAGKAGVVTGDTVVAVGGVEVDDWLDLQHALLGAGETVQVTVDGDAGERTVTIRRDPAWAPVGLDVTADASLALGLLPAELFVGQLSSAVSDEGGLFAGCRPAPKPPPTPAMLAGLEPGDRFLRLDGEPVDEWQDVLDGIGGSLEGEGEAATARPVQVDIVRAGAVETLTLEPKVVVTTDLAGRFQQRAMIGVGPLAVNVPGPRVRRYYTLPAAFSRASAETVLIGGFMIEQLGKMATGEASVRKNVGGPIEMVRQASAAAKRGLFEYARLMAVLSISLGIVNLLPVPVLDGGQLLFFFLEAVRGRPVSVALRERAQQIGVIFMVLLMLSVLVMDIQRWLGEG